MLTTCLKLLDPVFFIILEASQILVKILKRLHVPTGNIFEHLKIELLIFLNYIDKFLGKIFYCKLPLYSHEGNF